MSSSATPAAPLLPLSPGGMTLASLAQDCAAVITGIAQVEGAAGAEHVERLMELGFLPGETVRVIARGFPSGDPIAVRIGRATFALRRFEAEWIGVDNPRDPA